LKIKLIKPAIFLENEYRQFHNDWIDSGEKPVPFVLKYFDKNLSEYIEAIEGFSIGRNIDEIVRLVEALQTVDQGKVLTPANWEKGDDVMVPYYPYTKEQLAANPDLKQEFYSLGNSMWFKKAGK
jgi:hypothetical protein